MVYNIIVAYTRSLLLSHRHPFTDDREPPDDASRSLSRFTEALPRSRTHFRTDRRTVHRGPDRPRSTDRLNECEPLRPDDSADDRTTDVVVDDGQLGSAMQTTATVAAAAAAVGRTVVVGAVQEVSGVRPAAARVQAGPRESRRRRPDLLRRRTVVGHAGRVLGADRMGSAVVAGHRVGRAGALRAFGRVHAAGFRGDTATVAAAAAATHVDTGRRTVPDRHHAPGAPSPSAPSPAAAPAPVTATAAVSPPAAAAPSRAPRYGGVRRGPPDEASAAAPAAAGAVLAVRRQVVRAAARRQQARRPELAGQLPSGVHL